MLARASTKIGLKVNLDKTKVMVFRKGGHLAAHEKWFINGQRLEVVNSYVYPGYTHCPLNSQSVLLLELIMESKEKSNGHSQSLVEN